MVAGSVLRRMNRSESTSTTKSAEVSLGNEPEQAETSRASPTR